MRNHYARALAVIIFVLITAIANAQLTGTKNIPGDYATLALAITDLNTQGTGAGGVTLNILAGNPQTSPAGGYIIGGSGTAILTSTDPTKQVIIQGNGNIITASASHPAGAINDAIFTLIGADYITLTGMIMQENIANTVNTPEASNNMTEFGVALFYASPTDGAQNNTIQNNTISLNRTYRNTFGIYSNTRTSATVMNTAADISSPSGSNSFNKVYGNNINNINFSIAFIGSPVAANMDNGNDIGGSTLATGNNITNAGSSASTLSAYISLTGSHYIIVSNHQVNENISYNTIISAALTSTITEGGILKNYPAGQPAGTFVSTITYNTITVTNSPSAATGGSVVPINNAGITPLLTTASININNNTIQNCNIGGTNATTQFFYGIYNQSAVGMMNMNNNLLQNNSITATTSTGNTIILVNTAACNTLSIENNTCRGFTNTSLATTLSAGYMIAVFTSGAVVNTANINNNKFGDATADFFTKTNGDFFFVDVVEVYGGAAGSTLNINGNSFKGIKVVRLSEPGTLDGSMAILTSNNVFSSTININNNNIGTADGDYITFSGANTGEVWGIINQGGSPSGTVSINSNNFKGFVHTVPATSHYTFILNLYGSLIQNISNNTFTNLNLNTSGNLKFVSNYAITWPANAVSNINGNMVVGSLSKAAGNFIRLYQNIGTASASFTENNNDNSFTNITTSGNTMVEGIFTQVTGSTRTISGNVFSNITTGTGTVNGMTVNYGTNELTNNTISNISSQANVNGIFLQQDILSSSVYRNNIGNLSSTANTVSGINVNGTSSTTHTLYKNKIYNLQNTSAGAGTVNGIYVLSGGNVNMYNNLIGALTAPSANSTTDAIRGINLTSTMANSNIKVYFNTVYLNAASSGTDFSTAALYHQASAISTTAALDLRNNILVNTSVANGPTGNTSVFKRSGTDLANYATTSDYNLFYAGATSAPYNLMFDQVNFYRTLPDYKAAVVPRDQHSVTGMPPFTSTNGANADFLHIDFYQSNTVSNAGTPIPGINDDYDAEARNTTTPDIGADESFVVVPIVIEYFRGYKQSNRQNLLEWKVNVTSTATLTLERSTDGRSFEAIHIRQATAQSALSAFSYADAEQLAGTSFYRLKMEDENGKVTYSHVIALLNKENGFEIIGFMPNPVQSSSVLHVRASTAGSVKLVITDMAGRQLQEQPFNLAAGRNMIPLQVSHLAAGSYQLTAITAGGEKMTISFVKQ